MMKKHAIFLYELHGYAAAPWAEAGYKCFCYDIEIAEQRTEGNITYIPWDARNEQACSALVNRHNGHAFIILGFPPCTDLAVSGSRHFASKRAINPNFQKQAMELVYRVKEIADILNVPYAIENPISVISSLWRKPDYIFDPYQYGGYLPEDDVHPKWPQYIKARDAYPKLTCNWIGNGFKIPKKKIVPISPGYSDQHKKLGGKSKKTKEIRSMTPRGWARAVFEANHKEDE